MGLYKKCLKCGRAILCCICCLYQLQSGDQLHVNDNEVSDVNCKTKIEIVATALVSHSSYSVVKL
jgi:hypothetical protein